ncbi:hypothetical protein [Garciella nitratireducens]|uniref:hypothetical protein n=1 Tax=Garciella nitratireducens TaxID=218205 RepID=UPI001BD699AE|nr:hypothetical protein [Garciella nitratireducens]
MPNFTGIINPYLTAPKRAIFYEKIFQVEKGENILNFWYDSIKLKQDKNAKGGEKWILI